LAGNKVTFTQTFTGTFSRLILQTKGHRSEVKIHIYRYNFWADNKKTTHENTHIYSATFWLITRKEKAHLKKHTFTVQLFG
jgi:hypothetical protein